jgi:hypothetical protein
MPAGGADDRSTTCRYGSASRILRRGIEHQRREFFPQIGVFRVLDDADDPDDRLRAIGGSSTWNSWPIGSRRRRTCARTAR